MRAGSAWAQTPPARHTHTHTHTASQSLLACQILFLPPPPQRTPPPPSLLHHTQLHAIPPERLAVVEHRHASHLHSRLHPRVRHRPKQAFPSGMAWLSGSAPVPDRQCVLIGSGSGIGRTNSVSRLADEIEIESMHVNQRFQAAIRPRRPIILAGRSCRLGSLGPSDHVTIKTSRPAPWLGPTLSCSVPEAAAPSTRDP